MINTSSNVTRPKGLDSSEREILFILILFCDSEVVIEKDSSRWRGASDGLMSVAGGSNEYFRVHANLVR